MNDYAQRDGEIWFDGRLVPWRDEIRPIELAPASEIFLTGTAAEITPRGVIAEFRCIPGPVTDLLARAYADLARSTSVPLASSGAK